MDTNARVLEDLSSESTLLRQIAELRAENERLQARAKAQAMSRLACKVSDKGAVSVYGMGRFPVTLYAEQWAKLRDYIPVVMAFIDDNADKLSTKA